MTPDLPPVDLYADLNLPGLHAAPFGNSTGFSPAGIVLRKEMQHVLRSVSAMRGGAIQVIRPHYLLDLVQADLDERGELRCDFKVLDEVLDVLVKEHGFKMIFELMGLPPRKVDTASLEEMYGKSFQGRQTKPDSLFADLSKPENIRLYGRMVEMLARHLVDRYGAETVRNWWFETTNEPDSDYWWPFGTEALLRYHDECSEALKRVDPQLRFGGPGSAIDLSPRLLAYLKHCASGTNFVTGEKGSRLDFIAVHIKDQPDRMLAREEQTRRWIVENTPELANRPFFNDESDPLIGWRKTFWFRASPWYAGFISRNEELRWQAPFSEGRPPYALMSHDHTFLGGWFHRTVCASHYSGSGDGFALVRKPVLAGTSLVGYLNGERIPVEVPEAERKHLTVSAFRIPEGAAVLVTNFPTLPAYDKQETPEPTERQAEVMRTLGRVVRLKLDLPEGATTRVLYRLDEHTGNPVSVWNAAGRPERVSPELLARMRAAHELAVAEPVREVGAKAKESFVATSPSVHLLLYVRKPAAGPVAPVALHVEDAPGLDAEHMERIVSWKHAGEKLVKTYQVQFKAKGSFWFKTLNRSDVGDRCWFEHPKKSRAAGEYRVRAIDFWGRKSAWSEPVRVGK